MVRNHRRGRRRWWLPRLHLSPRRLGWDHRHPGTGQDNRHQQEHHREVDHRKGKGREGVAREVVEVVGRRVRVMGPGGDLIRVGILEEGEEEAVEVGQRVQVMGDGGDLIRVATPQEGEGAAAAGIHIQAPVPLHTTPAGDLHNLLDQQSQSPDRRIPAVAAPHLPHDTAAEGRAATVYRLCIFIRRDQADPKVWTLGSTQSRDIRTACHQQTHPFTLARTGVDMHIQTRTQIRGGRLEDLDHVLPLAPRESWGGQSQVGDTPIQTRTQIHGDHLGDLDHVLSLAPRASWDGQNQVAREFRGQIPHHLDHGLKTLIVYPFQTIQVAAVAVVAGLLETHIDLTWARRVISLC